MDFFNEEELNAILDNSKEVKLIVSNSVNIKSCENNLKLVKKYSKIKLAAGLYPEDTLKEKDFVNLKEFVKKNKSQIFAIGEIGLDKTEKADFELQKQIFIKQLELAKKLKLPAIIHTRKAEKEVIEILENYKDQKIILHCFSGNFNLIKRAIELGFYFSIPTNIVRSEHFQKLAIEIPRERILTETDTPYLSPYKETKNQPAYIKETIKKLSELWKLSEKEVEKQIEINFNKIYS
jgi:TatD DNase family protein